MKFSEQMGELAKALAAAQGEMTAPPKDKTAKVPTKSGGSYSYSYSDLATVVETVKKILSKNGLAVTQYCEPNGSGHLLNTRLIHSSGQWCESSLSIPHTNGPQELGSWLTYYRRYALCAILGVASEEDDDAQSITAPKDNSRPLTPSTEQQNAPQRKPANPGAPISQKQMGLLRVKLDQHGWSNIQLKDFCQTRWGIDSSTKITMGMFDELLKTIEAGAPKTAQQPEWTDTGVDFEDAP